MGFENDTDPDLLQYMAMTDDPGSREAWGVFFVRHREAIFRLVRSAYGRRLRDDHELADVVQETFRRAYVKAHQFNDASRDPEQQRHHVVAWLCRIAENIIKDLVKKRARLPTFELPDDEPAHPHSQKENAAPERTRRVREFIDSLPEADRMILLETLEWWNDEKQQSQMPKGALTDLAVRFGTTPANIRQRRHRLLERVEALFSEQRQQTKAGT